MLTEVLAWLIAAPLIAVSSYLALELLLGLAPLRDTDSSIFDIKEPVAILVPAHNEAAGIAETVADLMRSAPAARIVVIADNCTDDTAEDARGAGAEVFERNNLHERGKGYALAFGRDRLAEDPPAVVIVVDADCRLAPKSMERLAVRALATGNPVQAANLLIAGPDPHPLVAISNFAMLVKNLVRARGLARLSGGASLFGTGMAFPWPLFARLPLASAAVVEDLEMGLQLARQGMTVEFDDAAMVTSPAASRGDSRGQRSRWEHGFLQSAWSEGAPLLITGVKRRSRHLFMLGAHMLVPPLALYLIVAAATLALISVLCMLQRSFLPIVITSTAVGAALTLILAAWVKEGRKVTSFRSLMWAPLYVFWKSPIYLSYFIRRQTEWNRTRREEEDPEGHD